MEACCEAGGAEYLRKISKSHPGDPSTPPPIKRIELVVSEPPKNITPVKSARKGLLVEVPVGRLPTL